ncbi:unnamed protein product [Adineta steineri]|uniref:Uncharacterized protein n=1 Tax=Adineta steineri TaxID=433720 RepID=A0A813R7Z9_9BILA|nr:unnamed protein product [Adineta steineri]CAF3515643.1 unnamed protein product [Adineta steineri]
MKEYIYEVEHSWEKQREPVFNDQHHRHHHQHHQHRRCGGEDAAMDADASSMSETTSESGVSDLETSMTDFRCTCCPYGYHLDTDFMKFLDDMYGPDVLRTLKKIERKRHDVRRRLVNEHQPNHNIPISSSSARNSAAFDSEIIRETILELDRIVEKDIKDLEAECHRNKSQLNNSDHVHQHRSRSMESRRHLRAPPRPPTSSSIVTTSRTAEERRICEHRMQMEKTITTRTRSAPRLNLMTGESMSSLRKLDMTKSGPITMLYKIPPPPFSRSSSSSSLSTETTLRVSSPEPDEQPNPPLKPLYITEIIVPPKPIVRMQEAIKTTVVTITDKSEIERRNREIERLDFERKTLLTEKEILLKEIERYRHQPAPKIPPKKTTSITILTNQEQMYKQNKPLTREVAMQHMVEDDQPPPLPPKQRQQRDVAINHRTEYDEDEEKQSEIVRKKLEEIKNFYTERIHFLEEKIYEQEKDIERLNEPKKLRHVNTQCQPTMQDRALVTDTFRSVRDVGLTCHLQPTLPGPIAHRDVSLQCNTHEFIKTRDVWMEALPEVPIMRDVSIGVSLNVEPDRHFRDVGTHVNFDFKPEIVQRDVATMFAPEPIEKQDRSSNTQPVQTREFGAFANTIEPPKAPPKPMTRPAATDTFNLITHRDAACGLNEPTRNRDTSTDTIELISLHDRASGLDIPPELLSRHVSTDTRTLISLRDNFSATIPVIQAIHVDAQTQSRPAVHHDASSNTPALAEQRHTGIQAVQEPPIVKHNTTSTETEIFHQLGYLRHNLSNTDIKRSTDRGITTERRQSRELAVNTEPRIMYSKDVGDYDVRVVNDKHEAFTWNSLYGQTTTHESGFQTDLSDTKRHVGYINRDDEDTIEEQRQEIITFRLPLESRTTEETYETTITTEIQENNRQIEEMYETSITTDTKQQKRANSPEELVEESYEIISTLAKPPQHGDFFLTSNTPQLTIIQTRPQSSINKLQSSEDDSSYCEEWTVTEAKRKQDGETIQTVIDRDGRHRYTVNADSISTLSNYPQQRSGFNNTGTQIYQHEETTQLSPSLIHTSTVYEKRRKIGSEQTDINSRLKQQDMPFDDNEQNIEEKYEVTISTNYDESGLKALSPKPMMISSDTNEGFILNEEMYIACVVVNESLYDNTVDRKKVSNCLQLLQQEWFGISSQKEVNLLLIEGFLNSIKDNFSNFLLERIVNLQDINGNTALHYCVTNGHWQGVKMLLDTKVCDVCLQNNAGYTAVMMAAVIDITNDDQRQIVRRLFRESGNVNVKTKDNNQTALMLAVKHGKADLVELLIRNGAGVNLQDSEGLTALMYAVEHGSLNIVKLLLIQPECNIDIVDNNGQTAITIATNKNRKNILVELYAKIKEQKGHHSALGINSRSPNRITAADRSTLNSSIQATTAATIEITSPLSRRKNTDDTGPTVSAFRRYYSPK